MPSVNENSKNWSAFQVERRKVSDLKPYKNNERTNSKEQVAQITCKDALNINLARQPIQIINFVWKDEHL